MVTRKVIMLLESGIFTITMSSMANISRMPASLREAVHDVGEHQ